MTNQSILLLRSKLDFKESSRTTETGDTEITLSAEYKGASSQYKLIVLEKWTVDAAGIEQLKYNAQLIITKSIFKQLHA